MDELAELRRQVDLVDLQILRLISRRGMLVERITACKSRTGHPRFDPDRQECMLRSLRSANRGPFPADSIDRIFGAILEASLALPGRIDVHRTEGGD